MTTVSAFWLSTIQTVRVEVRTPEKEFADHQLSGVLQMGQWWSQFPRTTVLITPQLREGGAAAEFRFAVQTDGEMIKLRVLSAGATATSSDEKVSTVRTKIICDFIRQHGRCDMKELESGLKMNQRWLRERLRALEKAGRIKVEVEKVVRTRKYVYSIAD